MNLQARWVTLSAGDCTVDTIDSLMSLNVLYKTEADEER